SAPAIVLYVDIHAGLQKLCDGRDIIRPNGFIEIVAGVRRRGGTRQSYACSERDPDHVLTLQRIGEYFIASFQRKFTNLSRLGLLNTIGRPGIETSLDASRHGRAPQLLLA